MECNFLIILMLTMIANPVKTKEFQCLRIEEHCKIFGVTADDKTIELTAVFSSYTTNNINELTITNSRMDDIPAILSDSSLTLNHLSCIRCGLAEITEHSFALLGDMEMLDISYGSYTKLTKNLFSQLPEMTHLNLSHGAVSEIDAEAFFNLRKLGVLSLSHNNIRVITSDMFAPLERIWSITLSNNRISTVDDGLFFNNKHLRFLDIDHNNIKKIDGQLFSSDSPAMTLIVSYNNITALTNQNAETVIADHNKITKIVISSKIRYFDVRYNNITSVTCDKNASSIKTLRIAGNPLTELGCIGSLTQIYSLDLSYINIGRINEKTFARLTELRQLSLRSTNISKLEPGIFSHQHKLSYLDITYNNLGSISLDIFLGARDLNFLHIDGNELSEFPYKDLRRTFPFLRLIGIADNNFNCSFYTKARRSMEKQSIWLGLSEEIVENGYRKGIACVNTPFQNPASTSKGWTSQRNTGVSANTNVTSNLSNSEGDDTLDEIDQKMENLEQQIDNSVSDSDYDSDNTKWAKINQLINLTLEKQKISSRAQAQETNELKIEFEKKLEKIMEKGTVVQCSGDLMKNVNIILITLIATFFVYKGYTFVRNDLPRLRRYNTANTVHTTIEMDHGSVI